MSKTNKTDKVISDLFKELGDRIQFSVHNLPKIFNMVKTEYITSNYDQGTARASMVKAIELYRVK